MVCGPDPMCMCGNICNKYYYFVANMPLCSIVYIDVSYGARG